MKKLLEFLIKGIIPDQKFSIEESTGEKDVNLSIKLQPESVGLIIGKEGKTIKAIRNILRVKATLEGTTFFLNINEEN